MNKEYLAFVNSVESLPQGKEIEITIKDLTPGPRKYDARHVKAILSSSPDQSPGSDVLWLRSATGALYPYPWAIKVLEELGEFIAKPPYSLLRMPVE